MDYKISHNCIHIYDGTQFNIQHILECGQTFRFKRTDFGYTVYAKDQKADIYCQEGHTKIFCKNQKFFVKYFDLDTNYDTIKLALQQHPHMRAATEFGHGIRILRQDPLEMLISFIISSNNNIPRIKSTIEKICQGYGEDKGDYFAFPTLSQLALIPKEFFIKCGCGYRAQYLVDTIQSLVQGFDLYGLSHLSTHDARKALITLKGVGPKVADCVLLFGFYKTDVFPTDTWIVQAYTALYGDTDLSVKQINQFFHAQFGDLSGYAQQYLFYSKREKSF